MSPKEQIWWDISYCFGRDYNDQYLPINFGVVKTKTKNSWSRFINILFEDIGDRKWFFNVDKQKVWLSNYVDFVC